jgi:prevent-host-death family protein
MSGPELTVSAAEANRSFSKLLRAARDGARVTITSHGEPVAELGPVTRADREEEELVRRRTAHAFLLKRWNTLSPVTVGPWTRDGLYDRD